MRSPLTVMSSTTSFLKKHGTHPSVTFCGSITTWCRLIYGICVCEQSHKVDFSGKIGVLFQTLRSPVSKQAALCMVINFESLSQLHLVRVLPQVRTQNSPSWSLRKAKFLCTQRRIDGFGFSCIRSRTAAIFSANCLPNLFFRIWISYVGEWATEYSATRATFALTNTHLDN